MKKYTHLVNKYFKVDKKKSVYTMFGIVIAIILFVSIGEITYFFNKINLEFVSRTKGEYETVFKDITKGQMNKIKNNVKVENYAFTYLKAHEKVKVKDIERQGYVYALDDVATNYIFKKVIKIKEGHIPKNDEEIILDEIVVKQLNLNIGSYFNIDNTAYKVVGFYQKDSDYIYEIVGITRFNENKKYNKIYGMINVKGKRNKLETIESIAKDIAVDINYEIGKIENNKLLLDSYRELDLRIGGGISNTKIIYGIIAIFSGIIIYLSVSIALNDRVKQLGILKCMGADSIKLINLIFYESAILYAISIIPGILMGDIVAKVICDLVLGKLIKIDFYGIKFEIYMEIIFMVIILSMISVILASIIPAKRSKKILPIESSTKGNLNLNKIRKRKSKLIAKVFGYKGEIAYRNIRANNRTFMITTISLSVSFIAFAIIAGLYVGIYKNIEQGNTNQKYDFEIRVYPDYQINNKSLLNSIDDASDIIKNIEEILTNNNLVESFASNIRFLGTHVFTGVDSSEYLINKIEKNSNSEEKTISTDGEIYIYDDKSFNEIYQYIKGDDISLENFKKGEVILVNIYNSKNIISAKRAVPFLNVNNGEKIKFQLYEYVDIKNSSLDEIEKKFVNSSPLLEMRIMGSIDINNMIGAQLSDFNGSIIIMSKDFYDKNKHLLLDRDMSMTAYGNIVGKFHKMNISYDDIKNLKINVSEIGGDYIDFFNQKIYDKKNLAARAIVIYTILVLILIISTTNLINNKKISIAIRRREIGTMLAIGMDKKDLKKIIILEDLIQGLIVAVIGGSISLVALKVIYMFMYYTYSSTTMDIPVYIIVIGMVIVFVENMLGSLIVLRKFKNVDVAKIIREKE